VVAERVRQAVENAGIEHAGNAFSLTVSVGFACTDACSAETPEELFELADAACRGAKRAGRNRAISALNQAAVAGRTP
jgi:diguanylate cyclase (GGDEF)-like protein